MLKVMPEISEYNTDAIIKFLDDSFSTLNKVRISIFGDDPNNKLCMNLCRKLYLCGCQITLASVDFNPFNNREIVEHSDVIITMLHNNEINNTFHPFNSVIIDITGDSFTDDFKKFAFESNFVNMYVSK